MLTRSRWEGEKPEEEDLGTTCTGRAAQGAQRSPPPLKLSEILTAVGSISKETNHKREHASNTGFTFH